MSDDCRSIGERFAVRRRRAAEPRTSAMPWTCPSRMPSHFRRVIALRTSLIHFDIDVFVFVE